MDNLLHALAPAGATHAFEGSYRGVYRKFKSGKWYFWFTGESAWLPVTNMNPSYEPIPAREIELNRLADKCSHWYMPKGCDAHGEYSITTEEWQARRALRLEHGLILEPAPEVNETPYSQEADDFRGACASCGAPVSDQVVDPARAYDVNDTDSQWLPQVGEEFEFSCNGVSWEERVMLFNDGITCMMAHKEHPASRWHYKSDDPYMQFRPIKTERERFIDIMSKRRVTFASKSALGIIYEMLTESGVDLSPLLEGKYHE